MANSSWPFLSVGLSRQEHWRGLPCPPPGDPPNPGIKPLSLMSPALAGRFFTTSATWEVHYSVQLSVLFCLHIPEGNIETKLISIKTNSTEFNGNIGQPFPSAGDLPNPGIKPWSPALQADSLPLSHQFSSVQFSHSVMSNSLRYREPQHARSPYLSPTPGVHPNPCPSSQ